MIIKLKDIASVTMGQSPKSEYYNSNGIGTPFLQGNRTFGFKYPYYDTYTSCVKKKALKGDIIMSVRAPVGDLNFAPTDLCIGRGLCSIRAKDGNDQEYLYYLLKYMMPNIVNKQSGTVFGSINNKDIINLDLNIPNFKEQKQISRILSSIDEKILTNNRINDNLHSQLDSLFYEFWNKKKLIKNIEWNKKRLGDLVDIKRGGSPRPIADYISDTGYRWLKISDVTSVDSPYIWSIKEHIKEEGLKKTVLLKAGNLVLSNSATPGIPKIIGLDTCIHDGWLYFTNSKLSNYFLYLLFRNIRTKLISFSNGSIFNNLKTDIVKDYEIDYPGFDALNQFDGLVYPFFEELKVISIENAKLIKLRNALLPKLMSGEIDVSNIKLDL